MTTTTAHSSIIASDRVEGTTVYSAAGDKLGSIERLMIDKVSGKVKYAVLKFGGFLNIGHHHYPLPWNVLKYDTDKDGYVVPVDKAVIEKAPRYEHDQAPEFTSEYGKKVYGHYGTPWSDDPLE
ncbi:PRC-barrel domain-containing protein [soil metagenome]